MTSEPIYSATTERLYSRLPEFYRTMDAQNDWQLKTYISAMADQLHEIDLLVARIEYIPEEDRAEYYASLDQYNTYTRGASDDDLTYDEEYEYDNQFIYDGKLFPVLPIGETSDLFDGRSANTSWLPYIAQITGADLSAIYDDRTRRDAVIHNYLGFRAGSREALENAAKQVLTGTKYIRVYPHRDGAGDDISHFGTEWDVLLITKSDETPGGTAVVDEIIRKGAKPAGVVLHHILYGLIWDVLEATYTTWDDIESEGYTWANIETGNPDLLPV